MPLCLRYGRRFISTFILAIQIAVCSRAVQESEYKIAFHSRSSSRTTVQEWIGEVTKMSDINDVITDFLKIDFEIISLKSHNLAKSRNIYDQY